MSDARKENLFAKLAAQSAKALAVAETPSPAPIEHAGPRRPPREAAVGKRSNPDYCQALAYIPKSLRREVDRALLDIDGLDYSSLVADLLKKWLKSRGASD